MQKLDKIAEELFNKIRGRYPKVTLGTEIGEVTSDPSMARFFEFDWRSLGKVSVSLDEKNGVVVMYSKQVTEDPANKTQFFEFLRELRMFAKKRMLNFDTRDLTKSNLKKRDYQHLATTRPEEGTMTESKLYGTSRVSYQDIGNARLVVKHSQAVNPELAAGRTQNIQSMYIESAEGERFKYPYRHLNGARAMARHVAEGGNAYDDFGKHIVGLSEELSKLRKFKNYMGRSNVMAEGLAGYMDVVYERIDTVKKTIEGLQRPNFYKEAFENFETTIMEDVPEEVRENWIDQLTIRQFNEELADVFPYIYKLVSENTLAEEIGPEQLLGEERDDERIAKELMKAGYDSDNSDEELQNAMIELGYGSYMTRDRDLIGDVLDQLHDMTYGDDDGQPSSYDEYQDLYGGDEDFGGYDEAIESSIESLMGQFAEDNKKDVLFQIEDEDGDKYEVVKYMGKVVAFDANPEELPGGGMGPYEYDPKTGTIETEHGPKKTRKIGDQTFGEDFDTAFKKRIQFSISGSDAVKQYMRKKADLLRKQNKELDPHSDKKGYAIGAEPPERAFKKAMKKFGDVSKAANAVSKAKSSKFKNRNKPLPDSIEESTLPQSKAVLKLIIKDLKDLKSQKADAKKQGYDEDAGMIQSLVDDIMKIAEMVKKGGHIDGLDTAVQDLAVEYYDKAGEPLPFAAESDDVPFDPDDETSDTDEFGNKIKHKAKHLAKKGMKQAKDEEEKTPLGEFILSYFDRETGQFPKGETAVLTMVEKDYGENYIEPAKQFIEQVLYTVEQHEMENNPQQLDPEFDRMRELAGLR